MIRSVPKGPTYAQQKFYENDPWRDKTLSQINGEIKRMGKDHVREKLAQTGLETRGVKDVLVKSRVRKWDSSWFIFRRKILNLVINSFGRKPHEEFYLIKRKQFVKGTLTN